MIRRGAADVFWDAVGETDKPAQHQIIELKPASTAVNRRYFDAAAFPAEGLNQR